MIFSPNRPCGLNSRKPKRQHIGKPDLDAAADEGAQVNLGQLFAHADDQPANNRAGHRSQPAQNHHRQGAQGHGGERELHAQLAAPDHPGHQRHHTGHAPDDDPDAVQRNADGLRGLVVVGHGAQRPAGAVFWKNTLSAATSTAAISAA
jgi:hypothetical protein